MNDQTRSKDGFTSNVFLYSMASVCLAVSAFAVFRVWDFSISKLITLAVATIVAVLVSRQDFRVPSTKLGFRTKDLFAFWGIIWLGLDGGMLLGLSASIATCYYRRFDRKRLMSEIFTDAMSIFAAAAVYGFASDHSLLYEGKIESPSGESLITSVVAICAMGAIHFAVNSILVYFVSRIAGDKTLRQTLSDAYLLPVAAYLSIIAATCLADYTFVRFGIEFGWVILPVTILATVAHSVHERRLAVKTRQISDASRIHLATVEALATAIDARDQIGMGHVRRTQIFAIGIGECLGLNEDEINALRTGALLHDIGKLAVPDHILNKPGALTHAEIEKTKIHASVGASILEKVGFDTPVVPTVKYHHEHWDGSGYPEALRGENIPLTARVLAVADAYDTLRGARPYRPAVSRSEACTILKNNAGRKFDPELVQIFLENLDRLEANVNRQGVGYRTGRAEDHVGRATGALQQNFVDQIKLANREAFTLYELAKEFSSSLGLDETIEMFTKKIREFVHFDTCSVYLIDEKSGNARSVYVAGKHTPTFNGHEISAGEGVTGRVLETKSIIPNCDPWPDLQLLRSSVTSDYRSMVSLPLLNDENLIGVVSLYSTSEIGYSDEDLRLLETITRIASDAVAKSRRHEEAETHALTDPMTGLPNARSLQVQFERELARARRTRSTFQILMLDLDGFKQVNDTFGHKTGDRMLTEIARVISGELREYDFLARYAGDEFVALIPDTSGETVYELCRRIEEAVSEFTLRVSDETAQVGVSIGYATFPYSAEGFDQLLIAADRAMYSSKAKRKRARKLNMMIPRPQTPLEFDVSGNNDDIDTVVEIDETHIYSTV